MTQAAVLAFFGAGVVAGVARRWSHVLFEAFRPSEGRG